MKLILLGVSLFTVLSISAQRECATQQYIQSIISADASVAKSMREAEASARRSGISGTGASLRIAANTIIRIPVIVHILYNTSSQNISDAQIKSQIDALNRDFRRRNEDSINTPERFKSVAADVQIEFALATADPMGRATNGIVRKQTGVTAWQMDDKIKFSSQGGDDGWNSQNYLNIWVGNTRSLLGYASYIGGAAEKDGIVINTTAFGTVNVSGPYDKGRTLVHEAGHWMGLKHIWGDTFCGDDGIDDTPKQGGYTTGCPTGFRSSCSNGTSGDMYMNYMDFTNDACLNLFTKGQREKMRSFFEEGNAHASLMSSKGLNEPWIEELKKPGEQPPVPPVAIGAAQLKLYPNPAQNEMVIDFNNDASWIGKKISIISLNGKTVHAMTITSKSQHVSLTGLTSGVYFVQGANEGKRLNLKLIKL